MTDGAENASKHYSNDKLAKMIEHQRTVYNWEFIFLGATLQSRTMAKSWSVPDEDIDIMVATPEGTMEANDKMSKRLMMKRMMKD